MENEKKVETSKPKKHDVDKQVANMAYTIRKIKNWLEEKMGADIDGDGRVGSGPYNRVKKIVPVLLMAGFAGLVSAAPANTNIAIWYPIHGTPTSYVDQTGGIHAPNAVLGSLTVSTAITVPDASIAATKIILTEGQMIFGDAGTGVAAVVSGDVLIPKTGVAAIQPLSVDDGDIVLANTYIIVGDNGTGTAVVVSGDASMANDGALSVTQLNAIAVATVTDGAALGDTALQPGIITCTGVTNGITNCVVTFANTLASATTLTGWISETAGGAGTAVSLHDVSAGANTILLSASDESTVVFTGHTDGAAELDITVSAAVTRYFNVVQRDGAIKSSAAMIFDGP